MFLFELISDQLHIEHACPPASLVHMLKIEYIYLVGVIRPTS